MESSATFSDLSSLSRKGLEQKIHYLEEQNLKLKSVLQNQSVNDAKQKKFMKKIKKSKPFNFSSHPKRHVLLKILYLGWDRQGFVVQDDTTNTVEEVLFEALCKTKLIESRETSNYHRCGRTDKGVSAFSQVISITLRSKLKDEEKDQLTLELDYPKILNRVLPVDVRVLAWSSVSEEFSARFDCASRTYKYFFPAGNLNLELMNEAGKLLIGEHDYRNFCKMDVGNGVINFRRKILSISISAFDVENLSSSNNEASFEKGYKMCVATIEGVAFLWHQIRSIMTILFLVGEGKEEPSIIDRLLDVKNCKRKPQYGFACEVGLNLYDAQFNSVKWHYNKDDIKVTISQLQSIWAEKATKASMLYCMLKDLGFSLQQECDEKFVPSNQHLFSHLDVKVKSYKPLTERPTCESLEERVQYYVKRRKLDVDILKRIEGCELLCEEASEIPTEDK